MKVGMVPDGAILIEHLITKNGHEYLSTTNFSEDKLKSKDPYDENHFDYDSPPFNMKGYETLKGNEYASCETPSGIRGRLSLYDNIIKNADAVIILGMPPRHYKHMYSVLNELILFSCVGCFNEYNLLTKVLKKRDIPILELGYPTTRDAIINLINRINDFLQNLDYYVNQGGCILNDDNLSTTMKPQEDKISYEDFKDIVNDIESKKIKIE